MSRGGRIEALLRRDRWVALTGLLAICVLAWLYVLDGAGTGMSVGATTTWQFPPPVMTHANGAWPVDYWIVMLFMWWIMMIAMMVPSAAPMILLYVRVVRHEQAKGQLARANIPTTSFLSGYLLAWLGFSAGVIVLQWGLEQSGLVHQMMMWSADRWLTGGLLVAAGVYQFSPVKEVCLRHCRSPAQFLSRHWRPGRGGALRLGVLHGGFCVGCCWVLMLLLFVGGIMNLVWIAGLAVLVLIEKLAPGGRAWSYAMGAVFAGAGLYVLLTA